MRAAAWCAILSLAAVLAHCGGSDNGGNGEPGAREGGADGSPAGDATTGGGDDAGGDRDGDASSGSADAGTADGAIAEAGAPDGPDADAAPPRPLTAPDDTWTWVPFPDAFCGDGSATGLGINLSSASTRVLIYLAGGGACWSGITCFTIQTAAYVSTGYGSSDFAGDTSDTTYLAQSGGFFDRTVSSNPFKDYSYVYVPYCTGDMHAGDNTASYSQGTVHHVGYANMTAFLARIVPTFASADRVILVGSDSGGFGAAYNWSQTQQAFGATRVDLVDDSGPFMPPDISADGIGESAWRTQWNLAATLPSGCSGCATHLDALYGFYATAATGHRGALLSYVQDTTIPSLYGITTAQFSQGLQEDLSTYFASDASATNLRFFTPGASGHGLWFDPTSTVSGVTLQQFVTQMVTDDTAWANVQ